MKLKNMIVNCKVEFVEIVVLKFCVEKLVENWFIFIMGKECIWRKKRGGVLFLVFDEFINLSNFLLSFSCLCNE